MEAAGASTLYCRQGAGDWSDAPVPDLVISLQRNTSSSGVMDLGAGKFRLNPVRHRGIVTPVNTATSIHMDQPHDIIALGISFSKLQHLMPGALPAHGVFGPVHACELDDSFMCSMIERLWIESDTGNSHGRLFAEGALVAASLLRLSSGSKPREMASGGLAPWQIRRATEALTEVVADNITLASLANEVGLSPFHFSRAFKRSLGVPPHRYRARLRLEKACQLLETTDAQVTDIALQVGYESSQALARVFARDLGVSPTQWRRERRR